MWKDPDPAARWANLLVKLLNDRPGTQAQKESEWNVVYLQREIASTICGVVAAVDASSA
jgi:hypothetical protein